MTRPIIVAGSWLLKMRLQYNCHISVHSKYLSTSLSVQRDHFVRDRQNVNMVTLGASQHGKTSVASRLTEALSAGGVPVKTVQEIDHSASEREHGRSENVTHLELWREESGLRFSLADLPGNTAYIKNSLNHLSHADLGLLVISPDHGVEEDTKLFAYIANHLGIKTIVPVISMREDTDSETVDLINMELQELNDIVSETVLLHNPLVSDENIIKLLSYLEDKVNEDELLLNRDLKAPFYMAVEQVGSIPNRGTFCAGRVLKGKLSLGSSGDLEVFYQGKSSKVNVRDMEIFRKGTESLIAGDRGGAFLKVKQDLDIKRGAVLYDTKLKPVSSDQFEVSLKSVPGQGQGRGGSCVIKGDSVLYFSSTSDGKVTTENNVEIHHDQEKIVKIKLKHKMIAMPGDKIVMRNNQNYLLGSIIT